MSAQSSGDLGRLKDAASKHMIRYVGAFAPYFGMRAKGAYIYDDQGREILDFCSGQMCATLGHNHPAVTEAIEKSCETRPSFHRSQWRTNRRSCACPRSFAAFASSRRLAPMIPRMWQPLR